jgi:hypothetical protein
MSRGPACLPEYKPKIGHHDPRAHLLLDEKRRDARIRDVKLTTDQDRIAGLTS